MKTYFQKIILTLFLPLLSISFLIPQKTHALGNPDQYCSDGIAHSDTMVFTGNHDAYQVFVPTKNTLDAVSVWLKTVVGTSSHVKVEVINATHSPGYLVASMTKQISTQGDWITYDFPDVAMTYGIYLIHVKTIDQPNQAVWNVAPGTCYGRGFAIVDGSPNMSQDFGFGVYDYTTPPHRLPNGNWPGNNAPAGSGASNPATPDPVPAGSTPVSLPFNVGASSAAGTPPATKTYTSIAPPTSLTAKDTPLDYGGAIDLDWKVSTSTDIDGYKIFRRAEGDNEYVELARLPKNFIHFTDVWATKDKTFYYKLRSYRGNQESADSNVAFAASKDDMTGITKDILDDYKKNGGNSGILGDAFKNPIFIIVPIVIVLMIIGLFILGLWVLLHKKKQLPASPPPDNKAK